MVVVWWEQYLTQNSKTPTDIRGHASIIYGDKRPRKYIFKIPYFSGHRPQNKKTEKFNEYVRIEVWTFRPTN